MHRPLQRTNYVTLGLLLASAASANEAYSYLGGSFDSFPTSSASVSQLFSSSTHIAAPLILYGIFKISCDLAIWQAFRNEL